MARTTGEGGFTDLSRDPGGMIDTRTARAPFERYDRPLFQPLPRGTRNPSRVPNRQYDRYFPRSAKR